MESSAPTIDVLVTSVSVDIALIDAMARLALEARRNGCELRLRATNADVHALVELLGLADALRLEPLGQPERGEQLGIEEVVDPGDATA